MRISIFCVSLLGAVCAIGAAARATDGGEQPHDAAAVPALAEGHRGIIVGTTGPAAVRAGLEALEQGGSAADAAVTTALAQVVECGGAYVSCAGIFGMIYFEAKTGTVTYLNACYNTPLEEKDPRTIPARGTPSGRTALVPGFMAGIEAAHDRFGKLPRRAAFAPAIAMAEEGFTIGPLLGAFLRSHETVLCRLPETRRVFTKEDGAFLAEGDLFRQPELAETLRRVAAQGANYMYTGEWAKEFVAAVQNEGGAITLDDLKAYRVVWEEPLRTTHREFEVCAPGLTGIGGVAVIEALNLVEAADLPRAGEGGPSPASLFWLMQIGYCQALGYVPPAALEEFDGLDLSMASRIRKETAAAIWQHMQAGTWPFAHELRAKPAAPPSHSDGIVIVDRSGNVAAVTHSINTSLWGDTGIFVAGVSIPDSAAFQQDAIAQAGPGNRLPDPLCPLVVLRDKKPVLASSAIGGGLHQKTLQVLANVLHFGMDPQAAVEAPAPMLPDYETGKPVARVETGHFDQTLIDAVIALGQEIQTVSGVEAGASRGYWVGIAIDPQSGLRRAIGTRKPPLPSIAASEK